MVGSLQAEPSIVTGVFFFRVPFTVSVVQTDRQLALLALPKVEPEQAKVAEPVTPAVVLVAVPDPPSSVCGTLPLQVLPLTVQLLVTEVQGGFTGAVVQLGLVAAPQVVPVQAKVAEPVKPLAVLDTVLDPPLAVAVSAALQVAVPTAQGCAATAGQPDGTGAQVAAVALPQVVPVQAKVAEPV